MALALNDRVKETTIVTGTGIATLLGSSIGFQPFSVVGNGNTTYYCIADQFGSNWEVGIGTYTASGNTLARTTVLSSSNAGALVVFTAGIKDVFVTYPSSKGVWLDASGNAIGLGTPASGVVTNLTGTASININGTVGATTATTGAFTTLAYTGTLTGSTGILNIGSGQVYKDASGNVGIGTSSPVAQLGVIGVGQTTAAMSTSSGLGGALYVRDSGGAGGNGGVVMFGAGQGAFAAIKGLLQDGAANTRGDLAFSTRASPADATLTERMRIDASGKVGINVVPVAGTNAKLQITGLATNATTLATAYSNASLVVIPKSTSGYSLAIASGTGDFPQLQVSANGAASGDLLIQPYGGNVGIGTSSPTALRTINLEVSSSGTNDSAAVIVNKRGGGIATLRLGTSGGATGFDVNFNFPNTGDLGFYDLAAAVNRMRIDSSGNVTLQNNISVGAAAPTTSGTGITFPATQAASTNANTLDDYEEGTWTPNQGAGLTVVGTFGSSGTYTKIGRLVTVIGAITPTTSVASSNGGVISTNLPFTSGSVAVGSVADANGNGGSVISLPAGTSILSYPLHSASAALWFTITYFI